MQFLIDIELPKLAKSNVDKEPAHLMFDLRESAEPKLTKSKTLIADENLLKDLIDIVLPNVIASNAEMEEPNLACCLKLIMEPKVTKPNTETDDPILLRFSLPLIEIALPHLAKLLKLIELPR
jgi:hypothetical protein